jgi:hypothetical protein
MRAMWLVLIALTSLSGSSCVHAIAHQGVDVSLGKSFNPSAQYGLSLHPVGDGLSRWPTRDKAKMIALWHEIAREKCNGQRVRVGHAPELVSLLPQYCTPGPNETDCGFSGVSGDFSCGSR